MGDQRKPHLKIKPSDKRKVKLTPPLCRDLYVRAYASAPGMARMLEDQLGEPVDVYDIWRQTAKWCGMTEKQSALAFTAELARDATVRAMQDGNLTAVKVWYEQANKAEDVAFRRDVLKRLKSGELTVAEAAIEFDIAGVAIPDSVKIMLAKQGGDEPDPTGGAYSAFDAEDFDKRLQERFDNLQSQLEGLPERRAEIQRLRAETADAFGPDSEARNGEKKQDIE